MISNRNGNGQFPLLPQSSVLSRESGFQIKILGIVTLTLSRPDEDQGRESLE